jgi:hypothetical protein
MNADVLIGKSSRSLAILACLLMSACGGGRPEATPTAAAEPAPQGSPEAAGGPVSVLVTLLRGAVAPADYVSNLASLRSSGAQVLLLAAKPGPKPSGFDSLAIVTFKGETDLDAWSKGAGANLGAALKIRRADVLAHDGNEGTPSAGSFFAVNHYGAFVSPEAYRTYTRQYVVPNMANQKATGDMVAYTMYIEREPAGVTPMAVLVKEYLSPEAQVRAEAAKEQYKEDVLLKQPEWKRIHETKSTIRSDLTETFATAVP